MFFSSRVVYSLFFLLEISIFGFSVDDVTTAFESELWDEDNDSDLDFLQGSHHSPLPVSYLDPQDLPENFSWANASGISFLTKSLNQHVPQYCGSCWAHAALSSLADRIKIARDAKGDDINLSIQFLLNCGTKSAGSCHGGSILRTYHFLKEETGFCPYDTCQPYLACSSDSTEGFCPYIDTTCTPLNTCRTCSPGWDENSGCKEIDFFPNATVEEYGIYRNADVETIKAEIFARGPVGAGIAGAPLTDYRGGIFDDVEAPTKTTHAVSIVGWGTNEVTGEQHWIVRNSWGQYWGEMGYFRVLMGRNVIGIEEAITWATPGRFTVVNFPCAEDGRNCGPTTQEYVDPSKNPVSLQHR